MLDNPNHKSDLELGVEFLQRQEYQAATEHLERACETDPQNSQALEYLAMAYQAVGTPSRAIATLQRAISLEPSAAHAFYNLGIVLEQQKRFEEAAQALERALQLRPAYPKAQQALSRLRSPANNHTSTPPTAPPPFNVAPPPFVSGPFPESAPSLVGSRNPKSSHSSSTGPSASVPTVVDPIRKGTTFYCPTCNCELLPKLSLCPRCGADFRYMVPDIHDYGKDRRTALTLIGLLFLLLIAVSVSFLSYHHHHEQAREQQEQARVQAEEQAQQQAAEQAQRHAQQQAQLRTQQEAQRAAQQEAPPPPQASSPQPEIAQAPREAPTVSEQLSQESERQIMDAYSDAKQNYQLAQGQRDAMVGTQCLSNMERDRQLIAGSLNVTTTTATASASQSQAQQMVQEIKQDEDNLSSEISQMEFGSPSIGGGPAPPHVDRWAQ